MTCFFNNNIPEGSLIDAGLVLGNCEILSFSTELLNRHKETLL
ncbi:MAG: hypothetical protein OSJ63_02620 [Bacilli bacterium]|nr:hypothetical protein [Bacilli bacterium]